MSDREPQIGDVWREEFMRADGSTYGKPEFTYLDEDDSDDLRWKMMTTPDNWSLIGRVVPVDHPGVEALRLMRGVFLIGAERDDLGLSDEIRQTTVDACAALADLLAILDPPEATA